MSRRKMIIRKNGSIVLALLFFFMAFFMASGRLNAQGKALQEFDQSAVPQAFMDLYHDFTGIHDGSTKTIAQELADALEKKEQMGSDGPLILVIESGIYAYDPKSRKLIASTGLRSDDPNSGFYELTAVSHIGPAVAYLANLRQLSDPYWQEGLQNLLKHIKEVRKVNATQKDNWLDRSSSVAMKMHKAAVSHMVDYACFMSGSYIQSVLAEDGKNFTPDSVSKDFFNVQSPKYQVPFKNVMVGTFAMVALNDAYRAYTAFADKGINWSAAKVLIQFHAGTNYGGGLTKDSNHLYQLLRLISNRQLPEQRIFFTPYARICNSIGQAVMPAEDFEYYTKGVWYHQFARPRVAVSGSFQNVGTIFVPDRPGLPGDWDYSKARDIDDFMMRMKYSLTDNTQLLSNTIGFWMSQELSSKAWNPKGVQIPGVTDGFPAGVSGYPAQSPEL